MNIVLFVVHWSLKENSKAAVKLHFQGQSQFFRDKTLFPGTYFSISSTSHCHKYFQGHFNVISWHTFFIFHFMLSKCGDMVWNNTFHLFGYYQARTLLFLLLMICVSSCHHDKTLQSEIVLVKTRHLAVLYWQVTWSLPVKQLGVEVKGHQISVILASGLVLAGVRRSATHPCRMAGFKSAK